MSIVVTEDRGAVRHVVLNRPEKRNAMNQELLLRARRGAARGGRRQRRALRRAARRRARSSRPASTSSSWRQSAGHAGHAAPVPQSLPRLRRTSAKRWPSRSSARSTARASAARWRWRSAATCGSPPATPSSACPRSSSGSSPTSAARPACPPSSGLGRAKELIMTARTDRRRARPSGSAWSTASSRPSELEAATQALVEELLANSHVAVGRAKRVIDASARPALAQTLEMEVAVQEYCVAAARASSAPRRQAERRSRRAEPAQRGSAPQSTGPATSVWLPSGRPRISCTRARAGEQRRQVDARLDAHLVQHRDEVLGGDVAGRARPAPGSRRARRSSTRSSSTPASSAASTFARPCPRVLWKCAVSSTSSPSARARASKNSRTWRGLAMPVVSPKPISCAPASRRRAAISSTRSGGTWPS